VIHEKVHRTLKLNSVGSHLKLWTAKASFFPLFFFPFFPSEDTVNSEHYLSMLRNTFPLTILLQVWWFMQDGARLHTANVVLNFLHDAFNSHVISNQFPDHFAWTELDPK
jgi:hypothetical protein